MKHAGPLALASLEHLLFELRRCPGLVERTPGSFYRRSRAYLHFHEDAQGLFADIKLDATGFTRLRVTTEEEQAHLLDLVAHHHASHAAPHLSRRQ